MPVSSEKVRIDGIEFVVNRMAVSEQSKILLQIQKLLGGSIIEIASGINQNDEDQMKIFASAIDHISNKLDPEQLIEIQEKMLAGGYVFGAGKRIDTLDDFGTYDTDDPLGLMMQVFIVALKVNFEKSVQRLGKSLSGLMTEEAEPEAELVSVNSTN